MVLMDLEKCILELPNAKFTQPESLTAKIRVPSEASAFGVSLDFKYQQLLRDEKTRSIKRKDTRSKSIQLTFFTGDIALTQVMISTCFSLVGTAFDIPSFPLSPIMNCSATTTKLFLLE